MNIFSTNLQSIIEDAAPLLKQIDLSDFVHYPSPDKWSKKQILGHLIDSAYNNHRRFLKATLQDDLVFDGYDQVAWVATNNYQNRELSEIIQTWFVANQHLAKLIGKLPKDLLWHETTNHNFDKIGMNCPQTGVGSSLAYLIWDYIFHTEHHLVQIIPAYKKQLHPFDDYNKVV